MAEIAIRVDDIADQLLELGRVRETAVSLAVPDQHVIAGNGEDAAGAGHQRYFAEIGADSQNTLNRDVPV